MYWGCRTYDLQKAVANVKREFNLPQLSKLKIAIMGCVVNGPGEARHADIGIAGGNKEAVLFKHGQIVRKIKEENIIEELKKEILLLL